MIDKIPNFLKEKFEAKIVRTDLFPDEIKQFMVDYANFYEWDEKLTNYQIFKAIKLGIKNFPKCQHPNCNKNIRFDIKNNLSISCSHKHAIKDSNVNKYGVENVFQLDSVKNKKKITMLDKFGVEEVAQSIELREKQKQTMIEKYGVENSSQLEIFKEKQKQTMIEKYGVENAAHSAELLEKNKYRIKKYIWLSGQTSFVQGYEPIVLSELESMGYKFSDIKTSKTDMPEIWYFYKNKKRRYYPDIYIPSENKIIEVKSDYTLNKDLKMNEAKFKAVKDAGFEFRLEVR